MRYLIVADIHSNLEAFTAVLRSAKGEGEITEIWCLGDIIGYGPDPRGCLQLLREHPHICVAGNHDLAAIGKIDTSDFNVAAALATNWTSQHLSNEDIQYIESLPLKKEVGNFTLVHGSPRGPIWEYVLSPVEALASLPYIFTDYCLFGHSHVPDLFQFEGNDCYQIQLPSTLRPDKNRFMLNPGGVGQPRDRDPRASFVIYDSVSNSIRHYRVKYDISATQEKMTRLGLPQSLANRLSYGM